MNDIINIEGVNVLYTELFNDSNPLFITLMIILFFATLGFFCYFYIELQNNLSIKKQIVIGIFALVLFFALETFFYRLSENTYPIYYVSFDEDCNITEVAKEYEICDNKGDLYLLVGKDSKIYTEPEIYLN